jgi:hypothetical protein
MNIHLSVEKAVAIAWRFGLAMVVCTVFPALADPGAGRESEDRSGDIIGWKPPSPGAVVELPGGENRFRLAPGDKMTVVAKFRRATAAKGDSWIVSTPGWSFGVREDGCLTFNITGRGNRKTVPEKVPAVAPLHVPKTAPWPPEEKARTGRVPDRDWTTVAWTVNTTGGWGDTFRFYIDGVAQPADQGWAPLAAPPGEGAIRCGSPWLELAWVRIYERQLRAAEITELATTGRLEPRAAVAGPLPSPEPPRERRIFAHRMIGFGPSFAGNADTDNLASGAGGFLFPAKKPDGPDVPGFCREGHVGALHAPFASQVEEFKWEIGQALEGGVDGFVLDTCGGTHELGIPDNLVKAAEAVGGGFQVGLCLDFAWGSIESKVDTIKAWLARHRDSPALFRLKEMPAFATYGAGYMPPEKVELAFKQLRDAAGEPIYLLVDLTEFPNLDPKDQEAKARAYAALADGVTCFFSRRAHERNEDAFTVLARVAHELGKDWVISPWPNYYTPGRTRNMENIGADNSRYWDRMWQMARETRADHVMLTTWNDICEETTIMPGLRRHFTFLDLLGNYHGPWYRTGVEPTPTRDQVYVFYRPYRTDAKPPRVAGPRAPGSASQNVIEVRAFLVQPGRLVLEGIGERDAPAGMSSFEFESRPGAVHVRLDRDERTVLAFEAPEWITDRPWRQDFAIRGFSSEEAEHWKKWFPGREPHFMSEYGDADGNGLPNWFERYYFGRWCGVDPLADPDGDGNINLQEFLDGTDPRNPPVTYPVAHVWNPAGDFKADNETYPVLDARGQPTWEYEFARGGNAATFTPARLLVPKIPAWLESGSSWGFGVGLPQDGSLCYFGEGDSSSSTVWTSPVTASVRVTIDANSDGSAAPMTLALVRDATNATLWQRSHTSHEKSRGFAKEIAISRGERLRLSVTGHPGGPPWRIRLHWSITPHHESATQLLPTKGSK